MFKYSIVLKTDNETGEESQSHATDSGDSSTIPGVSSIPSISGVSAQQPPAAAARPTGRVLTRAVLESQQEIVKAIGGINDK